MAASPAPSRACARRPAAVPDAPRGVDQRVILNGISWRDYCVLRDLLDSPGVRMTYLEGTLEIMSPSRLHEDMKKRIARLLELYALEHDIPMYGYGSMTLRREAKERGVEPDECYVFGRPRDEGFPDLAVEVSVTSGGIDKLEVYRGLGVREVWIWIEGRIQIHTLGPDGCEPRERSELLPNLDPELVARFAADSDQHAVLKALREHVRGLRSSSGA